MPDLNLTEVSTQGVLAAIIVAIVLPALFVLIRIWNSCVQGQKLLIHDWFSILALLILAVYGGLGIVEKNVLDVPTTTLDFIGRSITAIAWMAAAGSWFAKGSILLMYVRIFGIHTWLRITSYAMLAVTFVLLMAGAVYSTVVCGPDGKTLDMEFLSKCINGSLGACVYSGIIYVVTDMIIFVLPIPIIIKLQMPTHKKIGVGLVFLTGILGIIISSITLYYRSAALAGWGNNEVVELITTTYENTIAIMVGCVPAVKCFWSANISSGSFYSKLQTAFSDKTRGTNKSATRGESAKDHVRVSQDSD